MVRQTRDAKGNNVEVCVTLCIEDCSSINHDICTKRTMMYERQDLDIASSILRDRDKSYSTLFCCSNSTTPMSYNERRSEEAFYFKGILKSQPKNTDQISDRQ